MSFYAPPPPRVCQEPECENAVAGDDWHFACVTCLGIFHSGQAVRADPTPDCEACAKFSFAVLEARHRQAITSTGKTVERSSLVTLPRGGRSNNGAGASLRPRPHPSASAAGGLVASPPLFVASPPHLAPVGQAGRRGDAPHSPFLASPRPSGESSDDEDEEGECVPFPPELDDYSQLSDAAREGDAASTASAVSPDPPPVSAIFQGALTQLALPMPVEEKPSATPEDSDWLLWRAPPPRVSKSKKIPVAPGFRTALLSSWSSNADPPKLPFPLEIAGSAELGFAALPPMDPVLAKGIARRLKTKPGISLTPKPVFNDPKERATSYGLEKTYRAVAVVARSLNATAILQGSVMSRLERLGPVLGQEADALTRELQLAIQLNRHATQWAGRSMANAAAVERARWLDLAHFRPDAPKDARKHLMALPLTPDNLFEGAADYLKETTEAENAESEAAAGVLADPPPPPPVSKPRPDHSGERGRSSSRRGRSQDVRRLPSQVGDRPREASSSSRGSGHAPASHPPPPTKAQRRETPKNPRGRGK